MLYWLWKAHCANAREQYLSVICGHVWKGILDCHAFHCPVIVFLTGAMNCGASAAVGAVDDETQAISVAMVFHRKAHFVSGEFHRRGFSVVLKCFEISSNVGFIDVEI